MLAEEKLIMEDNQEDEHPKLAICTYHNNEDIWKIPRMIEEMNSSYQFYMRYNGNAALHRNMYCSGYRTERIFYVW